MHATLQLQKKINYLNNEYSNLTEIPQNNIMPNGDQKKS